MRVHVPESFGASLSRLEPSERAAVKRAAFDYLTGPMRPGQGLHRLVHAEDHRFWSLRVNRDLRIIVRREGEDVVLCHAGHHDAAYSWAAHRTGAPGGSVEAPLELGAPRPPRGGAAEGAGSARPARADPAAAAGAPVPGLAPGERPAMGSRHDRRLARRASAPLPEATDGTLRGEAPAPLAHLLRFFGERPAPPVRLADLPVAAPAARGPPSGARPPSGCRRPVLACAAWSSTSILLGWLAAGTVRLEAGTALAVVLGQALWVGWLLREQSREAARALEAAGRAAEARADELASALESLLRGDAPELPEPVPGGGLGRAWATVDRLGRFLALSAGDLRELAALPVARRRAEPLPGGDRNGRRGGEADGGGRDSMHDRA